MTDRPAPRPLLALALLAAGLAAAAPPARAVRLALAAEDLGCFNLVDLHARQIQMLPWCALVGNVGDAFFPEVHALWAHGDGFLAVTRDVATGETALARFASLTEQDLASGVLQGTAVAELDFADALGAAPEVRDATVLPGGGIVLLVEDPALGRFWVCDLDPDSGEVTPRAPIDPDAHAAAEGAVTALGVDAIVLVALAGVDGPAFFIADRVAGTALEIAVRVPGGAAVGPPSALTADPDGHWLYSEAGAVWRVIGDETPAGEPRVRFVERLVAGRDEWYLPSRLDPQLAVVDPAALPDGCVPDGETLCLLDGRFRVTVEWADFAGNVGRGQAIQTTADSGELWFFSPANVEMLVKILDGCGINGHVWVFAAATTTVELTLRVVDVATGTEQTYSNPLGTPMVTRTHTEAFPGGCDGVRAGPAPHERWRDEALRRLGARASAGFGAAG